MQRAILAERAACSLLVGTRDTRGTIIQHGDVTKACSISANRAIHALLSQAPSGRVLSCVAISACGFCRSCRNIRVGAWHASGTLCYISRASACEVCTSGAIETECQSAAGEIRSCGALRAGAPRCERGVGARRALKAYCLIDGRRVLSWIASRALCL